MQNPMTFIVKCTALILCRHPLHNAGEISEMDSGSAGNSRTASVLLTENLFRQKHRPTRVFRLYYNNKVHKQLIIHTTACSFRTRELDCVYVTFSMVLFQCAHLFAGYILYCANGSGREQLPASAHRCWCPREHE